MVQLDVVGRESRDLLLLPIDSLLCSVEPDVRAVMASSTFPSQLSGRSEMTFIAASTSLAELAMILLYFVGLSFPSRPRSVGNLSI